MSVTFAELVGLSLGLALLIGLGWALLALVAPDAAATTAECWALAFLLGTGGVSLLLWWLSPLFALIPAVWSVTLAIFVIAVCALAVARRRSRVALRQAQDERKKTVRGEPFDSIRSEPVEERTSLRTRPVEPRIRCYEASSRDRSAASRALAAVLLAACGALAIVALVTPLGWDGVLNFELKARLAFLHHPSGTIPLRYFADTSRAWSHPQYPLMLPLTEAWLYGWIGSPNQSALKLLFPLFYFSLMALFFAALRRHVSHTQALAGCVGFALIPSFAIGPGGATTGYADVPLAAFVFGAVSYACSGLSQGRRPRQIILAAILSGLAAWTKPEGVLLAGCLVVAVLAAFLLRVSAGSTDSAHWKRAVFALALGPALVVIPWWVFQRQYGVSDTRDFLPFSAANIEANYSRLPLIAGLIGHELLRAGRWAALWPAFVVATLVAGASLGRSRTGLLTMMVVGPLAIYAGTFTLSAWPNYRDHLATALPRLLLPLAPMAWLATLLCLRDALHQPDPRAW